MRALLPRRDAFARGPFRTRRRTPAMPSTRGGRRLALSGPCFLIVGQVAARLLDRGDVPRPLADDKHVRGGGAGSAGAVGQEPAGRVGRPGNATVTPSVMRPAGDASIRTPISRAFLRFATMTRSS
jgi:hypothetical protein